MCVFLARDLSLRQAVDIVLGGLCLLPVAMCCRSICPGTAVAVAVAVVVAVAVAVAVVVAVAVAVAVVVAVAVAVAAAVDVDVDFNGFCCSRWSGGWCCSVGVGYCYLQSAG